MFGRRDECADRLDGVIRDHRLGCHEERRVHCERELLVGEDLDDCDADVEEEYLFVHSHEVGLLLFELSLRRL